ncbi:carbohydrate kinase family protein [Roseibacillus persicicus]|uniref:carbohydrate kinase family protein n=1 Tax=Roseibacillus persicicus TaxID=454148 RepID=UPI0028107476|nr:carbohydrate kinase [Roseibacillus persicicus]MDQ8189901.1 carbohydrate kinase [Roseibacillus persicicus]
MSKNHKIAGIGEILWDMFPDGSRLGGAPVNFASHCHQLGCEAYPVSVVGRDRVGVKTRERLGQLNMSDKYVFDSMDLPTGRVLVLLDSEGKPSYEILEEVAWDDLVFTPELCELSTSLDAACFGTLAQRSPRTRRAIHKFLEVMPARSLRIYDVNLRQPFFSKELVENSLKVANVLKLSDEELPVLAEYFQLEGAIVDQLKALRSQFGLSHVAYTRGGDGSLIVSAGQVDECAGVPVTLVDTVGAGDSFTAALTFGLLNQWPLDEVNLYANQVASFVCSQKGATPRIPSRLVREMVQH